jgi:Fur family ferric uptake transcriptional regulator
MVCVETGDVIEFVNEEIERLQHAIAEDYGYELLDHSLVLYVKQKDGADADDD